MGARYHTRGSPAYNINLTANNMTTIPLRKLSNGLRYGTGPDGNRVCLGAYMGRGNVVPDDHDTVRKMRLTRLRMYDYAYDSGGAYWGQGIPLYWAYGDSDTEQAECFVRGNTREEAKRLVRETFPNARFYR